MDRVARQTQPIKLEIGGIGCLPKWSKPREVRFLPFITVFCIVFFPFASETNPFGVEGVRRIDVWTRAG